MFWQFPSIFGVLSGNIVEAFRLSINSNLYRLSFSPVLNIQRQCGMMFPCRFGAFGIAVEFFMRNSNDIDKERGCHV